jgi:hypothetical protein
MPVPLSGCEVVDIRGILCRNAIPTYLFYG